MSFDNTLIILVALIGLVLLILVAGVGFILWRRNASQQAAQKATAKKRQAKTRQPKPATPQTAGPAAAPTETAPAPPVATPARPATPATSQPAVPPPAPTPTPAPAKPVPISASADKIRILIVDDNPDTRENVSRLLYFENDMEVIGQAVNGRQGIEMTVKLKPHIVLMDINMPDMDGITATEHMSVEAPYSQVIIMSVQAEQHYMKRAMAAGARDFQPKPFTSDELVNCVRRVYDIGRPIYQKIEAAERMQAKVAAQPKAKKVELGETATPVIAVYGPKGGVGVSAMAINLAVALQQSQGEAVLMDGDLQFGDISVNLNVRPTRVMSDMVHEGQLDIELLPEVILSHDSGLKLLLAPSQPQLADTIAPDMIPQIIKGLKNLFKVVVIDTSTQLTDITLQILEKADYILIVTGPELPAIKSAKLFLELAGQLEFTPDRLGVVVNRANLPGGVGPAQIAKVLKIERPYLVPDDFRLFQALHRGLAVNQQDPNAASSQAMARIAAELWQKLNQTETETAAVSAVV